MGRPSVRKAAAAKAKELGIEVSARQTTAEINKIVKKKINNEEALVNKSIVKMMKKSYGDWEITYDHLLIKNIASIFSLAVDGIKRILSKQSVMNSQNC